MQAHGVVSRVASVSHDHVPCAGRGPAALCPPPVLYTRPLRLFLSSRVPQFPLCCHDVRMFPTHIKHGNKTLDGHTAQGPCRRV